MVSSKQWRTIRLIVEIPVRGDVQITAFCHDIRDILEEGIYKSDKSRRYEHGRFRVKDYNRVKRHLK